ncbi:hypothetical protein BGX24_006999, partial [Mortierella sp. AD032]
AVASDAVVGQGISNIDKNIDNYNKYRLQEEDERKDDDVRDQSADHVREWDQQVSLDQAESGSGRVVVEGGGEGGEDIGMVALGVDSKLPGSTVVQPAAASANVMESEQEGGVYDSQEEVQAEENEEDEEDEEEEETTTDMSMPISDAGDMDKAGLFVGGTAKGKKHRHHRHGHGHHGKGPSHGRKKKGLHGHHRYHKGHKKHGHGHHGKLKHHDHQLHHGKHGHGHHKYHQKHPGLQNQDEQDILKNRRVRNP